MCAYMCIHKRGRSLKQQNINGTPVHTEAESGERISFLICTERERNEGVELWASNWKARKEDEIGSYRGKGGMSESK